MKLLVLAMFFLTGCGSLKINPRACRTNAVWGSSPYSTRGLTRDEMMDEKVMNLKARETFLVFYDRNLRLLDLLKEHGIKCEDVKRIRVEIKTTLFFIREVVLKVVKN